LPCNKERRQRRQCCSTSRVSEFAAINRHQRQHEAFDPYPSHSNRREEYVQDARQNDQIKPSTTIPTTPGTGSRPQIAHLAGRSEKRKYSPHLGSHLGNPGKKWVDDIAEKNIAGFRLISVEGVEAK
jgi:hypothetical protein